MTRTTVARQQEPEKPGRQWIDICAPTEQELTDLKTQFNLNPSQLQNCLEPGHLPKHEELGSTTFLIIRSYDPHAEWKQDSVQSMTRKLALFLGDGFLVSIHRSPQAFLDHVIAKRTASSQPMYLQVVLLEILMAAVETYHEPLEALEGRVHGFEQSILAQQQALANWEEVYRTKCRLTVIKRILWHMMNTVQKFVPHSELNLPLNQNLRERIESLQFFADSLLDDLNSLLNVQMALASHHANEASIRTNEVMRVLTMFSAFFLPITFLVGVYGMNFEFMPETHWRYGYFALLIVLGLTAGITLRWFRKKGWM